MTENYENATEQRSVVVQANQRSGIKIGEMMEHESIGNLNLIYNVIKNIQKDSIGQSTRYLRMVKVTGDYDGIMKRWKE